ncbi:protein kinase A regulatory subunit [Hymenopellis radicata]|nr:protein kinase A regulatory subunit [Hymenopellis radicata]
MSTFDSLVADLTRDAHRVQPKDALQFCANWFQSRLEEQRARARDALARHPNSDLASDIYQDAPLVAVERNRAPSPLSNRYTPPPNTFQRSALRNSVSPSPFGTLDVPGNALLSENNDTLNYQLHLQERTPTSPLTMGASPVAVGSPFAAFDIAASTTSAGDYLHPPTSAIFARRTSVSAESIMVDSTEPEELPVYPKTPDQLARIKASISNNFIFRDLDEEQETGVINAMQEKTTKAGEVVIRQGDVGDYFYAVESGLLHCYIRSDPLPPAWLADSTLTPEEKFVQPGYHPDYGRKVAECKPGTSFGELALMYGHPRAATVMSIEPSTLWALDRITFRTIILKAAHRRRTMYEYFLSSVTLLSSLDSSERSKIADALVSRVYMDGEAVVKQGEMGDTFFFVEEGEAVVTKSHRGEDGEVRELTVGRLKKGDYFGELSLLTLEPRAATVSAVNRGDRIMPSSRSQLWMLWRLLVCWALFATSWSVGPVKTMGLWPPNLLGKPDDPPP